jgi:transcriptional regulator with XRE-family HTH domain
MTGSLSPVDHKSLLSRHAFFVWLRYAAQMQQKDPRFQIELGARLKEARLRKQMTMQAAADVIGCAKSALGHWETGRNAVSVADLLRLAELYGVPPEQLIPGEPARQSVDEQFIRAYAQLDEAGKAAMLAFMSTYNAQRAK